MLAKIFVTPKKSVLDPQGEAVRRAIHSLGLHSVDSTRVGKYIELEISGDDVAKTRAKLEEICRDLLSNPVVEDYQLVLGDDSQAAAPAPAQSMKAAIPARKIVSLLVPKKEKKKDKKEKKAAKAKKADKKSLKSLKVLKAVKVTKALKSVKAKASGKSKGKSKKK